jgi:uncharacterized protein (TIGR03067 family)
MWRILAVGLVGITSVAMSAPGAKDAPKKDLPIVGEWLLLSIDDKKAIPSISEFRIDGTHIISIQFGSTESSFRSQYEVNEKVTPPRIDLIDGDMPREGIFKIEGEQLTICWREGRGKRPKEFGEKGATQEVFERVKKKD